MTMTLGQFNARFRPLVDRAWARHAGQMGLNQANKIDRDAWYRDLVLAATAGRVRSTRDATDAEREALIVEVTLLLSDPRAPYIDGWTEAQNYRFANLAQEAWEKARGRGVDSFSAWLRSIFADENGAGFVMQDDGSFYAINRTGSFDRVMSALAVAAGNEAWMERTAASSERRLRYQIRRFLVDLDWLTNTQHDWSYVRGIWTQSQSLPLDLEDAPLPQLVTVLQILDTHIRRLCREAGIRPMELPTRAAVPAGVS